MITGRLLRMKEVRVLMADGEQKGVMTSRDALELARSVDLDLVLVAPNADPPVCRVIDFGKYKYDQEKRDKENKKHKQELKGIKITPRIAEHDLGHLAKTASKFFAEGDKVRVVCMFRQRELVHPQIGKQKMDRFAELCADVAVVERPANLEGRQMSMIMMPKVKGKGPKQDAKNQDEQDGGEAIQDHGVGQDHAKEVE